MTYPSRPLIHWVSPLPPAETDIAHYTARILPELSKKADVVLWTDAESWDPALEAFCPVQRLDPDRILPADFRRGFREAKGPEIVFIHIGNSWVYHSGFLRLAQRIPSVVVLHDLAIQEMLADSVLYGQFEEDVYRSEIARWYGDKGAAAIDSILNNTMRAYDIVETIPGFEVALTHAISVLTHSAAATEAVQANTDLPCYQLDLPFQVNATAAAERAETGPLRLVQFGHIGPNRRLEQSLEALAGLEGNMDFTFDIIGKIWDVTHISKLISNLGLGGRVRLRGFVPEIKLDELLSQAHLVINLRYPTMGEASGSQLRIWNAAAAAVVTEQGWYASLPDDTVFRISLNNEIPALQSLLRRIDADRRLGADIGRAGRSRLMQRHQPEHYVSGLIEIAQKFGQDAQRVILNRSASMLLDETPAEQEYLQDRLSKVF